MRYAFRQAENNTESRVARYAAPMNAWDHLTEPSERMRWARLRAGFQKGADAARALGISEHTYRTYERSTADGGRWPSSLASLQAIAQRFNVDWTWLATGNGSPLLDPRDQADTQRLTASIHRLPVEKREDAIRAALSVLESYSKT